jgi:CBASS immunity sensor of nucleotide second messenger signals
MDEARSHRFSAKRLASRNVRPGKSVDASERQRFAEPSAAVPPKEVTRYVPPSVQCLLWGKAAGRCEFAGCNQPLWKSSVTQEQVNIGQKAHIYAFSGSGPRGHSDVDLGDLHDLSNLMLVCHGCHRKIDKKRDGGRYTVSLLQQMKATHEGRIEVVSAIAPEKSSHVLLYGANIGAHSSPLNYVEAAAALFPDRYPAADRAIELSVHNSSFSERDAEFWRKETVELRRKFDRLVRVQTAEGEILHLSVFALAPQPLLILLGSLLGDIVGCDVYQRHREPTTWGWPVEQEVQPFRLQRPGHIEGPAALVLEVSGSVSADRIQRVLGENASIWSISVPEPHNDVVKSRRQTAEFRSLVRTALEQIKAAHGHFETLHIFPAMAVSLAVELGRVRMPKADMPWAVYDQVNSQGGFVQAVSIPEGERE